MIADYYGRLACLCFASFFLVHTAAGAGVLLLAPAVTRRADRMPAKSAAALLFVLRLVPFLVASSAVTGLCVPSYLWLEPRGAAEPLGKVCIAAAALGMALWAMAGTRAVAGLLRTMAFGRQCHKAGTEFRIAGRPAPLQIVDAGAPLVALSGVLRPKLFLARVVFDALGPEELDAALRHEDAHRNSRDNLRRFAFLLAPEILPLARCFTVLERNWAKYSEWAADDEASGGDSRRALWLASALVRVARLGTGEQPELAASLTACGRGLEARVARLLRSEPVAGPMRKQGRSARNGQLLLAAACTVALVLLPGALACVHGLLERLVR